MAFQSQDVAMGFHRHGSDDSGAVGDFEFSSVGDPTVADRMGWPVDELRAHRTFDWADGDGVNPHVGGVLTATGAPVAGLATPWRGLDLAARTASAMSNAARLSAGASPAIDDAHDLVAVAVFFVGTIAAGTSEYPGSYGNAGTGLLLFRAANALYAVWRGAGPQCFTQHTITPGWQVLVATCDRNGNVASRLNGTAAAPAAYTAGAMAGPILAAVEAAGGNSVGLRHRIIVHVGAGIADIVTAAWAARLEQAVLGLRPRQGGYAATYPYARASTRCSYSAGPTGRVHILGTGIPPAGSAEGLGADEQIVSVTSKNHGLVAGDDALVDEDVGITVALVDDSANLGNAAEAGPNVIRLQNSSGGPLYARFGNAIGGSPDPSWASIRARVVSGAVQLGFQTASGAFTQAKSSLEASYARSCGTATPGANTDKLALLLPDGTDCYVILWCAGVGARIPDEVPSQAAAGASATVVQGTLTTTHTPSDQQGTIELDICPRIWGTAVPSSTENLVSRSGGATGLVATDGAGNATTTDGTNTASAAIGPEADGTEITLRASRGGAVQYITQVGGTADTETYDGVLAQTGTVKILGSCRAVRGLRIYRAPRWRTTP